MSGDLRVRPAGPRRRGERTPPRSDVVRVTTARDRRIADARVNGAIAAAYDDARLRILRSLERGEIDVAEAGRRLETARRRRRASLDEDADAPRRSPSDSRDPAADD